MFYTDEVTLQTPNETNNLGNITITWTDQSTILCDVQPLSKEKAFKEYGLTDGNVFKKVFADVDDIFTEGYQVSFDNKQWWVIQIHGYDKIGASNHQMVILKQVI